MLRWESELEEARQELAPQWNEDRAARLYAGTLQRKRRSVVRTAATASIAALATVGALVIALQQPARVPSPPLSSVETGTRSGHTLRVADGSFARLIGERSELEVAHNSPARVELKLLSGQAHFEVVPNRMRSFVVEAQPYRVEVIGTSFDVERTADQVSVSVQRGKVRVYGPQGAQDVVAGQVQRFARSAEPIEPAQSEASPAPAPVAPAGAEAADAAEVEAAEPVARARARTSKRSAKQLPEWRSLSRSGEYEAAFESLRRGQSVDDDPVALMDAADAARLSGHPQSAVKYLERVVRDHARSPVAPLAAFTLGRVYLDKLGHPERASQAFELARRLSPEGSLAQDALAREVEALSKGGNAQQAYLRAQQYLERYPNGRRVRAVQLYGGME
jgi:transmembrane sensor